MPFCPRALSAPVCTIVDKFFGVSCREAFYHQEAPRFDEVVYLYHPFTISKSDKDETLAKR